MYRKQNHSAADPLARGLGWFSLALGAVELLAPRTLGRALGMERHSGLIQGYGAREIATGIAILSADDPTPFIWGRVAGDAMDLATLVPALDEDNRQRGNAAMAAATVVGVLIVDLVCAITLSNREQDRLPVRDYSDRSGFPKGRPRPATAGLADESEAHPS